MRFSFLFTSIGLLISSALGFLVTLVSARYYSKDIVGNYQYFLTLAQFLHLIYWLRMDQFVVVLSKSHQLGEVTKGIFGYLRKWILLMTLMLLIANTLSGTSVEYNTLALLVSAALLIGFNFIQNQYFINQNTEYLSPFLEIIQKAILVIMLLMYSWQNLAFVFVISLSLRFILGVLVNYCFVNQAENTEIIIDYKSLRQRGIRMFFASVASYGSSLILITLLKLNLSTSYFADYMLTIVLISFPTSVFAQYFGAIIQRKYLQGNNDKKRLLTGVVLSTLGVSIVFFILPNFKLFISQLLGEKWFTIWRIYSVIWPIGVLGFIAALFERLGYELGHSSWQVYLGIFKLALSVCLYLLINYASLIEFEALELVKLIVLVLGIGYFIDFFRNVYWLFRKVR